jgi:hypothetical protein
VTWGIILVEEVVDWYSWLLENEPETAGLMAAALNVLEEQGPNLGRPLVDRVSQSTFHHMKELRPGSRGNSEVRVLFAFDPARQAVLLVAGDKAGDWNEWYLESIPEADRRYQRWLDGGYKEVIA